MTQPSPKGFTGSFVFKLLTIGVLIATLMIPLFMIDGLVNERKAREREAKEGIALGWAPRLKVGGPLLIIPFKEYVDSVQTYLGGTRNVTKEVTNYLYFYPSALKVTADAKVSERRRGIFKANIYAADMDFAGHFGRIDSKRFDIPDDRIQWDQAFLMLLTPNGKSVSGEPMIKFNGHELRFQPRWRESYTEGFHLRADIGDARKLIPGDKHEFKFSLSVRGTEDLYFLPTANDFALDVKSDWPTPSFQGAALPFNQEIGKNGFKASWSDSLQDHHVSSAGRAYGRIAFDDLYGQPFGVKFFDSVDRYQQAERTIKYGMLFILLTFLSFFIFEIKAKLHLHPFQYLLIGSANCMFYLLLLSLSEHMTFSASYLVASLAVVLLIAGYAKAILHQLARSGILGGVLALFYSVMFFILVEQEYALLFGATALFLCLATVMFLTRNIDWYRMRQPENLPAV